MKFNNLPVAQRMWGTIVGTMLAMIVLTGVLQFRLGQLEQSTLEQVEAFDARITLVTRWRGMTELNVERSLASTQSGEPSVSEFLEARVKAGLEKISGVQKEIVAGVKTDAEKSLMEKLGATRQDVLAMNKQAKDIKQGGDMQAARTFVEQKFVPAVSRYLELLDSFLKLQETQREEAKQEAVRQRHMAQVMGTAVVVLLLLLGAVLATLLVRSITQPLNRAVALAEAISEGDFTVDVYDERKDELGKLLRSLSTMAERLRALVAQVHVGVETMSTASKEIAHGNQDLSIRTEQTASNLQQTASSMEELTSTLAHAADNAQQANQLAIAATQVATHGGDVVNQVVDSMQQINESSRKISDIIGVIDGIAFQTNILALNAAVEAARAGEQGRGFAVVASEVRSLAGRSATAAKEIKNLISASGEAVQSGSRLVAEAGSSMGEVISSVQRVSDLIGAISASSVEQRSGINQINQAVAQLDQMTQQNAALVEESAAAASSLKDQAGNLSDLVSVFRVD